MEQLTVKEIELIRKSFANGNPHVFDNNDTARKVDILLTRAGVEHSVGDYLHEVNGSRRYNFGIAVKDMEKLNEVLKSEGVEEPVEPEPAPEKEEKAAEPAPAKTEQKTAPKSGNKKAKRNKKIDL